ncbi:OsmC family protein [Lederbergia citrea]|uniref:OsmC family protein n=1 Tax=Lederbergia citrea TaxID=2833581 RepID=A0A942UNH6_9BACI|nr:OsmC family protein [Lederbergia citrea]MBS4205875.1 OsmC family protein [Lederbergia citrea]MBS4224676.1 OsmC family protein [Lederbergia citrea]
MEFNMKDGGFYAEFDYGRLDISGDEKYGIRPYQLLVSSLAVCSGGVLRNILEKMRMDVDDIHISAEAERNEEKANRIEKVNIHFKIKGSGLEEARIEKAMKLTKKNCSMVQSISGAITVEESFEIINDER